MRLVTRAGLVACLFASGCATTPPIDNPALVRPSPDAIENPVLVSPGVPTGEAYREVFEKTIDILGDYFELLPADPYDGRIVSKPRIAPGYEQFWKPGNPDTRGRLLASFQTIRQTATAKIYDGERGGFLVYVVVEKELEDLPRPTQARVGSALFQDSPTVDRQLEVVGGETSADQAWFKIGRDYALEQQILCRIRNGR